MANKSNRVKCTCGTNKTVVGEYYWITNLHTTDRLRDWKSVDVYADENLTKYLCTCNIDRFEY